MDKVGDSPWMCDQCGRLGAMSIPDVYFKRSGETYQNLTDKMGRPIEFSSRGDKAVFMKSNGIREAGDSIHGSRNIGGSMDLPKQSAESRRQEVRRAVADAKKTIRRH